MTSFAHLAIGDAAFSVHRSTSERPRRRYAILERVQRLWPARRLLMTLPCYANGEPMLYFGRWWRQADGLEVGNWAFTPPRDRRRDRLLLDLPAGVALVRSPPAHLPTSTKETSDAV